VSAAGVRSERGERTRRKILRHAERLFASEGVDNVTLRQIARVADQSNVSAVQYHFGSKERLLDTILSEHIGEIDDQRRQRLAETGARASLEELLEVLVGPLVALLDDARGRDYLLIQAQRGPTRGRERPATRELMRRIRDALGADSSDPIANRFVVLLLFSALADRARTPGVRSASGKESESFSRSLVRALAGLLRGASGGD
jgi:AcrR family transcriptional regulator